MKAQAGICAEPNLHALYLMFNRTGDAAALTSRLASLPALWEAVSADFPDAAFSGLVAVGADAWDDLYPVARPPQFRGFMAQSANGQEAPIPRSISSCNCVLIGWTCCIMPVIA
jgi:putative iron-dependent peroxidase